MVIGGGRVAERKVHALLRSGASVHVISPTVTPRLALLAARKKIELTPRAYQPADLEGPASAPPGSLRGTRPVLVFAATNSPHTQRAIKKDAAELGALVNAADDADESDFIVPATIAKATCRSPSPPPAQARRWPDGSGGSFSFRSGSNTAATCGFYAKLASRLCHLTALNSRCFAEDFL